jgi:hypothetical protein
MGILANGGCRPLPFWPRGWLKASLWVTRPPPMSKMRVARPPQGPNTNFFFFWPLGIGSASQSGGGRTTPMARTTPRPNGGGRTHP